MSGVISLFSNGLMLACVVGIPLYGAVKKIDAFDAFVVGAKQGFEISMSLIPYLVAMLVAVGMLRASGFFSLMSQVFSPVLNAIGMPVELLPLALVRPFSGAAATGVMAELMHTYGGNSFIAKTAATMMGSTETTLYVVAIYFASVNIRRTRHAIWAGLLADLAGMIASVAICRALFLS